MIIVDAHLDLAWNMATFNRDYSLPVSQTREQELDSIASKVNGNTLLGWPEFQQGQVAIVFATLFAAPIRRKKGAWDIECYVNSKEAFRLYSSQLDLYHRLVDSHPEKFTIIKSIVNLHYVIDQWNDSKREPHPVGLVILMEGAEAINHPDELEEWYARGLRIIGPAWTGTRFCGGTNEPGGLTKDGYALLEVMDDIGIILDISHMDSRAALQALDFFPGTLIASHANANSLLKDTNTNRHLPERVIQSMVARDGVIGVVPFNKFLKSDWTINDGKSAVSLQSLISQIDHICQVAGNANHVGLGSDFDGGFGTEAVPHDIDNIADLQKLVPLLVEKGYNKADIEAIMGKNWIRILNSNLPKGSV
jgi:membrane dipeptidase